MTRLRARRAGRPEEVISLTSRGVAWLREKGAVDATLPDGDVSGERLRCVAHQQLLNWFRIHLMYMERKLADVLRRLDVAMASVAAPAKHLVLRYVRTGIIRVDHVADRGMRAAATFYQWAQRRTF